MPAPSPTPTATRTLAPTATPIPTLTPTPVVPSECSPGEPCAYLYGTRTTVKLNEPVLLDLSIVNSIVKPAMTVQLLLRVPSGWTLSGAGSAEACTGQCTAKYEVRAGGNRSTQITVQPNQPGSFVIQGRLEWFFGEDKSTVAGGNLSLPVTVEPPATPTPTGPPVSTATPTVTPRSGGGCTAGAQGTLDVGLVLLGLLWPGLALAQRRRR